jgi:diguanylate cyclase
MIDPRSIAIVIVGLEFLMAAMLWLASRNAKRVDGVRTWNAGQWVIAVGLACNILQTQVTPALSIVAGNTLMVLGVGMQLVGIRQFKGFQGPVKTVIAAALVTAGLAWFFTFNVDMLHIRVAYVSAMFAIMTGATALELLIRVPRPMRTAYWLTGGAYGIYALASGIRAAYSVAAVAVLGTYSPILVNAGIVIAGAIMIVCTTFGLVLMVNIRLSAELERLASIDSLTGALNRRSFAVRTRALLQHAVPTQVAVIMLDIDGFKAINDEHGHPYGDMVLQALVQCASEVLARDDLFARMGGEEFCALVVHASEDRALAVAESIRAGFAARAKEAGEPEQYSVSAGVSSDIIGWHDLATLLLRADDALYQAKATGRDRVVRASTLPALGVDRLRRSRDGSWITKSFLNLQESI